MNKGIMVNYDETQFWYTRKLWGIDIDEEALRDMVRFYAGTGVTDMLFSAGVRAAQYPSAFNETFENIYQRAKAAGRLDEFPWTVSWHETVTVRGYDPLAVYIDECRKNNMRGWLTFRMNDCHNCADFDHPTHPKLYTEHPEYRRIRHRAVDGYYDYNFDYEYEVIRKWMLDIISECLDRYAPDGIELDWQREVFCFCPGRESREIMTAFMREVNSLVRRAEEKCGHEIPIAVRTLADPEDALEFGFDVAQWADEGLVRTVVVTPRWASVDTDMPLGLWKRLLRGTGVEIAAGVETLIRPTQKGPFLNTRPEHVQACAAQYFSQGADKTYLFNYFDEPKPGVSVPGRVNRYDEVRGMLKVIGDPEKSVHSDRVHMITFRDMRPQWRKIEEALPAVCEKPGQFAKLRVVTGEVPSASVATLRLGIAEPDPDAEVYVNSRPAKLVGKAVCEPAYTDSPLYLFELSEPLTAEAAVVEVAARSGKFTIDYADILITGK